MIKQVIVIRKDLKMRRGKEIAQGSHASMAWLVERVKKMELDNAELGPGNCAGIGLTADEEAWLYGQHTKVTVTVDSSDELNAIFIQAVMANLEVHMVTDAGKTEFNGVPTQTCLAIGPDDPPTSIPSLAT